MLTLPCLQQAHIASLETTDENRAALLVGLDYLLKISFVEDDEVFKICLDYWNYFVPDVYSRCTIMPAIIQHSATTTRRTMKEAPSLMWDTVQRKRFVDCLSGPGQQMAREAIAVKYMRG